MKCRNFVSAAVLLALFGTGRTLTAQAQSMVAAGSASNPASIKALAADAYVWGLGPEYIKRFSNYNTIIGAPFNAFQYHPFRPPGTMTRPMRGTHRFFTSADSSNFDRTPELVLTVPPSRNQYYVVAYYDGYANTVGSIGTRTTPSNDDDVLSSRRPQVSLCQQEDRED